MEHLQEIHSRVIQVLREKNPLLLFCKKYSQGSINVSFKVDKIKGKDFYWFFFFFFPFFFSFRHTSKTLQHVQSFCTSNFNSTNEDISFQGFRLQASYEWASYCTVSSSLFVLCLFGILQSEEKGRNNWAHDSFEQNIEIWKLKDYHVFSICGPAPLTDIHVHACKKWHGKEMATRVWSHCITIVVSQGFGAIVFYLT